MCFFPLFLLILRLSSPYKFTKSTQWSQGRTNKSFLFGYCNDDEKFFSRLFVIFFSSCIYACVWGGGVGRFRSNNLFHPHGNGIRKRWWVSRDFSLLLLLMCLFRRPFACSVHRGGISFHLCSSPPLPIPSGRPQKITLGEFSRTSRGKLVGEPTAKTAEIFLEKQSSAKKRRTACIIGVFFQHPPPARQWKFIWQRSSTVPSILRKFFPCLIAFLSTLAKFIFDRVLAHAEVIFA